MNAATEVARRDPIHNARCRRRHGLSVPCTSEGFRWGRFAGYLDWLVAQVAPAVERWDGLETTVARLGDEPRWRDLEHFDTLHRGNVNRTYVQIENGQTGEIP